MRVSAARGAGACSSAGVGVGEAGYGGALTKKESVGLGEGGGGENSSIQSLLAEMMFSPQALDRTLLCVTPGKAVWRVFVDCMVLIMQPSCLSAKTHHPSIALRLRINLSVYQSVSTRLNLSLILVPRILHTSPWISLSISVDHFPSISGYLPQARVSMYVCTYACMHRYMYANVCMYVSLMYVYLCVCTPLFLACVCHWSPRVHTRTLEDTHLYLSGISAADVLLFCTQLTGERALWDVSVFLCVWNLHAMSERD